MRKDYAQIALMLAWQDVRQAYRRSAIGPFWLTLGMAVQIVTTGLVFGLIFKVQIEQYLPYLTASIIFWGLISTSIIESCQAFINAESLIKQIRLPNATHVLRAILRNLILFAHNFVIFPILTLFYGHPVGAELFLLPIGMAIVLLNLGWIGVILSIASTRFRDMPLIVNSAMTIAFYVTPVMWYPKLISSQDTAHFLLGLNPLYHLLQIVRLPALGQFPTFENWASSLGCACIGWIIAGLVYVKYSKKIAYWI